MADKKSKIVVNIYNQSYTLLGEANPDYMLLLAKYVDTKMREIGNSSQEFDTLKIAILAAVNIASELIEERSRSNTVEKIFAEKSESLINLLDKTLDE